MNDTELSLLSALGGAVGALILRSLLKLVRKFFAEWKPLATYDCADDSKRSGGCWHNAGKRVLDDPLAINKRSWEHTPKDEDTYTVFGPYVNDFGRPGYYRAVFRIYGAGFDKPEDPVVVIDIVQSPVLLDGQLVMLGQRTIRGKELKNRYQDFDVYCYAAGSGTYEYRCLVRSEAFDANRHVLRFDTVDVFNYEPIWELL